jgi:hypothetical protein
LPLVALLFINERHFHHWRQVTLSHHAPHSKPELLEKIIMITFLILYCLKLHTVHLVSRGYYLLEIVQVTLQLIVKRTSDLNLVISDRWQW